MGLPPLLAPDREHLIAAGRVARHRPESSNWWDDLEGRDRQIMEDGKRLQKYYEAREKENEARLLADPRKWQDEEMEWRRQNSGFYTRHNQ